MSADDIPYQLRPNKFIDRQIFLEAMSRLLPVRGPESYIYVSMGGRHLMDHHAAYYTLGIQALYSFDKDANEVARQKFNRPTGKAICEAFSSSELAGRLDEIMSRFRSRQNLIVWLDYTSADRRSQFQESKQTLVKLKHGDIFRVTLNADIRTFGAKGEWRDKAVGPGEYRIAKLRSQIGEFVPTIFERMRDDEFPATLSQCLKLLVESAQLEMNGLTVLPILLTTYSDGTPMLTATFAIADPVSEQRFPPEKFKRWKFASRNWEDIRSISSPVLSLREQYRLDQNIHRGAQRMLAGLKFEPAVGEEASLQVLQSYKDYHRYYPNFRPIED